MDDTQERNFGHENNCFASKVRWRFHRGEQALLDRVAFVPTLLGFFAILGGVLIFLFHWLLLSGLYLGASVVVIHHAPTFWWNTWLKAEPYLGAPMIDHFYQELQLEQLLHDPVGVGEAMGVWD